MMVLFGVLIDFVMFSMRLFCLVQYLQLTMLTRTHSICCCCLLYVLPAASHSLHGHHHHKSYRGTSHLYYEGFHNGDNGVMSYHDRVLSITNVWVQSVPGVGTIVSSMQYTWQKEN
ncbi:uncharacterized protein BCR38DRAFT_196128 [Pseudomassariella vexata]|uniref:Uncharacterized protein n=1 Tax=Pseudomassariella vexata TaxID=1141098 RepID=A0A1Y2E1J1_9PEZI|nr:uncharacterized protein BCR38DRAFT_196128 [Pseudomassariella vexata]ORY65369.1 hypothetical protein BCR38DRAFT_196128 [Pseudomassariella vexata]